MKNLWDPKEASQFEENSLQMRVYSSRLLGNNSDLVLHGGGNTSVKFQETNLFGEEEEITVFQKFGFGVTYCQIQLGQHRRNGSSYTLPYTQI